MLRSKEIKDYFEVEFSKIRKDLPLPFEVYLYFSHNRHIMLWIKREESPSPAFIEKYTQRGIRFIWIHKDDRSLYEQYLRDNGEEPEKIEAVETPEEPQIEPKTLEGAMVSEVLRAEEIPEEEKKEVVAELAKSILNEAVSAKTPEEQKQKDQRAADVVKDILDQTLAQDPVTDQIWNLATLDSELKHSVNVATYTVLFALAFGRIDPDLMADLARSGLLHDVGLSQLPRLVSQEIWQKMNDTHLGHYSAHVNTGVFLTQKYLPDVAKRVTDIIAQHHEKFNGSGYPNKISGFDFDDVAQLLGIADRLSSISQGRWDGKAYTMKLAFQILERSEEINNFPEYFNPELFKQIQQWISSSEAKEAGQSAAEVVQTQVKDFVGDG